MKHILIKQMLRVLTSGLAIFFCISGASADVFKPMKYLQEASVVSALAGAVSQLDVCEEDLTYSEETKKGQDGNSINVVVTCNKFPEDGKLVRSSIRIEFELDEDGGVGAPLGFDYD